MKKIIFPIITLAIIAIFIIFKADTSSSEAIPYPKIEGNNPSQCLQSTANELVRMRNAWNNNLSSMLAQEKPTSDMVDEAYESMRTYRCWLEYLCQDILYSGNADKTKIEKEEAKGINIGIYLKAMPGCMDAEDIQIPGTKLKFMPHCHVDSTYDYKNTIIETQFQECQALLKAEFADPNSTDSFQTVGTLNASDIKKIKSQSSAFIGLESALKTKSAGQKSRILQEKLNSILNKMSGMEYAINILSGHISRFDQKMPCFISKCD